MDADANDPGLLLHVLIPLEYFIRLALFLFLLVVMAAAALLS